MEKKTLFLSTIIAVVFAVIGILGGIIAKSDMILFDGAYSLISAGLSVFSIFVLTSMTVPDEDNYPFGKAHFEPMIIILKSMVIIGMCIISVVNAISNIVAGGHEIVLDLGLYYSVLSALGCLFMALLIKFRNKKLKSEILKAEFNQWTGDTLLSFGVLIGFLICLFLKSSGFEAITKYIDSIMVICSSVIFITMPTKSLVKSLKEMLLIKAEDRYVLPIENELQKAVPDLGEKYKLRVIQIGRELSIEVSFLTSESVEVKKMDQVRDKIMKVAESYKKNHWVNINFTSREDWL